MKRNSGLLQPYWLGLSDRNPSQFKIINSCSNGNVELESKLRLLRIGEYDEWFDPTFLSTFISENFPNDFNSKESKIPTHAERFVEQNVPTEVSLNSSEYVFSDIGELIAEYSNQYSEANQLVDRQLIDGCKDQRNYFSGSQSFLSECENSNRQVDLWLQSMHFSTQYLT